MNGNITHPQVSSEIAPVGVYDLDTLRSECKAIGIEPTRPNIRRIRRAIDLHQSGAVEPWPNHPDNFYVDSQTEADKCYVVLRSSGCHCPDAQRMTEEFTGYPPTHPKGVSCVRIMDSRIRCKHEMATMLYQEQRRCQSEQAELDEWADERYAEIEAEEADRFACDPEHFPCCLVILHKC